MSNPTPGRFRRGVTALSYSELGVYLAFGALANALLVAGFPRVGGFLSAMVLATYLAAISDPA